MSDLEKIRNLLRNDYETCRVVVAEMRRTPARPQQDPDWELAHRVLRTLADHLVPEEKT